MHLENIPQKRISKISWLHTYSISKTIIHTIREGWYNTFK